MTPKSPIKTQTEPSTPPRAKIQKIVPETPSKNGRKQIKIEVIDINTLEKIKKETSEMPVIIKVSHKKNKLNITPEESNSDTNNKKINETFFLFKAPKKPINSRKRKREETPLSPNKKSKTE